MSLSPHNQELSVCYGSAVPDSLMLFPCPPALCLFFVSSLFRSLLYYFVSSAHGDGIRMLTRWKLKESVRATRAAASPRPHSLILYWISWSAVNKWLSCAAPGFCSSTDNSASKKKTINNQQWLETTPVTQSWVIFREQHAT